MSIRQKKDFVEWGNRRKKDLAIINIQEIYYSLKEERPKSQQKKQSSNVRAMVVDILEVLDRSRNGRYKGRHSGLSSEDEQIRRLAINKIIIELIDHLKYFDFTSKQVEISKRIDEIFRGVSESK